MLIAVTSMPPNRYKLSCPSGLWCPKKQAPIRCGGRLSDASASIMKDKGISSGCVPADALSATLVTVTPQLRRLKS